MGQASQADLFRHSNVSRRDLYRLQGSYGYEEDELEAEKAEINASLHYQHPQQQQQQYAQRILDTRPTHLLVMLTQLPTVQDQVTRRPREVVFFDEETHSTGLT